ncbi:peptidase M28 domain-containing protein [Cavenderia fasciculata]|uniref:Carboxypeptidase Q n=1 Tax=Cavenderia fasciculata TaxID=261658 RepID=F4Q2Z5_CACFS|nr:peptidase M28 domain-containing protein [Cavenderia fasciculata]EGG17559.1 peptidase M28 domain-containing protein [Cavenderia fasciculata]|eukprot:XP_004356043.1 peptidase M28 domain-containing protein [Cavenderia fasciculata]
MIDSVKYSILGEQEIEHNLLLPQHINPNKHSESLFERAKKKWKSNWRCYTLLIVVVLLLVATIVIPVVILSHRNKTDNLSYKCESYSKDIIDATMKGTLAYSRIATMCALFGNRLSGSTALENAINWVEQEMITDGLANVHKEPVNVTHWVRGNEYASIQSPYFKKLNILGLGGSINTTSQDGITGEVLVVTSFDDLTNNSALAVGKIVLFNVVFTDYGTTVQYRVNGPTAAAKAGAIACLVRSIAPYSLGNPHTGGTATTTIPAAAVTLEDADLMQGLQNLNQTIVVNLYMEAQTLPDKAVSHNVMGDVIGSDLPDEVVVVGGHIDSWDVGQGAMDDGGGVMVAWEAVRLIKALGIVPRRTIRVVAWTNEENGAAGGANYALLHANETFFSIETDGGVTQPYGIGVQGASDNTIKALSDLGEVLKGVGSDQVSVGEAGTDNYPLVAAGVPGGSLLTNMTQYFWYHHSEGDGVDKLDSVEMDKCVATLATWLICLANFNGALPQ